MKNYLYLLLVLTFACGPKNDEVKDEMVDVAPPADALDSIAATNKDALKTDENEISVTLPMPQPVMQLLAQQYPGWKQPELSEEARQYADASKTQGPIIVRGDLDNDTRQDVALQLQQDKDIVMVAALQPQDGVFELHELTRDIMFNDRGKLKSMYYLYLLEKGEKLLREDNAELGAEHDAVAVGIEGQVKGYLYQNGAFQPYRISE
ncbi:hypothetical protein ACXYMU_18355 [Pontibacter sp. CAU 1760]